MKKDASSARGGSSVVPLVRLQVQQQQKGRLSNKDILVTVLCHCLGCKPHSRTSAQELQSYLKETVPTVQKSPINCSWCKDTRLIEVTILGSPVKPHTCLPPLSPPRKLPVSIEGRTGTQPSTGCAQEQVYPSVGHFGFAISPCSPQRSG